MIGLKALQERFRRPQNRGPNPPSKIWVLQNVLESTVMQLRTFRKDSQPHEGIMYWAGLEFPGQWIILNCIKPIAETTYGSYRTTARANAQVISVANKHSLHVLGQVHSHPGHEVAHSLGDIQGAFMPFEGFLSIVVPHYAAKGMMPLSNCGVHRFENHQFRRLAHKEVTTLFYVLPLDLNSHE